MSVLAIVVPVFVLIALGYCAARFRLVSDVVPKGLSEFAFTLAVPALLFKTVGGAASVETVSAGGVLGAYFGAVAATWLLAALITWAALRRPQADAASIALSSTYGNAVMLGLPLAFATFGDAAAAPIAIILSINTPVMWFTAALHSALAERRSAASLGATIYDLGRDLLRNPLILAIAAGALWRLTGLGLAPVVDRSLALIAQAGVPCALVALGTTLTGFTVRGQLPTLITILILKLAVMPVLAYVLAVEVLRLPPVAAAVVVLFAAMPTGANAYLFAERSQRAVNSASGAVALGSLLSIATTAVLIAALRPG